MSNHEKTLVPLESWSYASPELLAAGVSIDIGLFAEALIYYDCVIVNVGNQPQFAKFLEWFAQQGCLDDFLALVDDGSIELYEYSFHTAAAQGSDGAYTLINIQDPEQAKPNTFEQRFLYHPTVEAVLPPRARGRKKFYRVLGDAVVEAKAAEFGSAIDNANEDFADTRRAARVIQVFVDEIYLQKRLRPTPTVQAALAFLPDGKRTNITWNIDLSALAELAGPSLNFGVHTPVAAAGLSNRFIFSAAELGCDLYLPRPMSSLVGDKLYEGADMTAKSGAIIEDLKETVEFPDVRGLVNSGKLGLADVLMIRKKAPRFRSWLQSESDRDRDAIIAYHIEVARESGFVKGARKALNLFGAVGGGATGAWVGAAVAGPPGGALGAAAGAAVGYVADVAAKLGADWKPVVFGDWQRD